MAEGHQWKKSPPSHTPLLAPKGLKGAEEAWCRRYQGKPGCGNHLGEAKVLPMTPGREAALGPKGLDAGLAPNGPRVPAVGRQGREAALSPEGAKGVCFRHEVP